MPRVNKSLVWGGILSLMATVLLAITSPTLAVAAAGDADSALTFNGTNQYVGAASDASTFDISNAISLEAWVYPTGSSCEGNIVGKATSYFLYCVSGRLN